MRVSSGGAQGPVESIAQELVHNQHALRFSRFRAGHFQVTAARPDQLGPTKAGLET